MKKLLILFTLVFVLTIALSITSVCFADEELPVAQETPQSIDGDLTIKPIILASDEETTTDSEIATSDNNALVWLKETWEKVKHIVLGAVSGIGVGTIVSAIFVVVVKRATNKGFDKIEKNTNSTTIADLSSQKILDKLSNVALDVNIKPVLASQYKAMSEEINGELTINLQKQDKKNLAVINLLEKLGNYFDCSVAVSDEKKDEFKQAVQEAKDLYANCDNKVSAKVEIVAEAPKQESKKKIVENY